MSLPVLAQHMASRGRNGDTMLVHMTPGEVHGLHALAVAHGGKLTINPETGLPEANFLKKLLPMIAGFALAPLTAGTSLAFLGATPLASALTVGGITGLATGSLQKGLMAGLGAYGGAGLAEGLSSLGTSELARSAAAQSAFENINPAVFDAGASGTAADVIGNAASSTFAPSATDKLAAGFSAAKESPLAFAKSVAKPLMYAAAPVMADAMVPTTTPRESTPGETGYIQPRVIDMSSFGQAPGAFTTLPPIAANRLTYPSPPPGGAAGGIVALAAGGTGQRTFASAGDIIYRGDPSRQNEYGFDPEAHKLVNLFNPVQGYLTSSDWQDIYSASDPVAALRSTAQRAVNDPAFYQAMQQSGLFPGEQNFGAVASDIAKQYGGRFDPSMLSAGATAAPVSFASPAPAAAPSMPTIGADVGGYSLEQKADLYNKLLSQGYSNEAIRQAATQQFGAQPDTDWGLIQRTAAQIGSPEVSGAERYVLTTPDWKSQSGLSGLAGLNANIQQWAAANPNANYAQIQKAATDYGVDTQDIHRALQAGGGSAALQYVTTAPQFQARSGETGIAGLSSNINRWLAENKNATREIAQDEMKKWGLNENDVIRATGKTLRQLFPTTTTQAPATTPALAPADVTGGGVSTFTTATTPTFQFSPAEQAMKVPTGDITGGTTTGTVDTKEALRQYELTAPTGTPPKVSEVGTRKGYEGKDVTYGGLDVPLPKAELGTLGTAGKVTRGTETMADVRRLVGDRYAPQTFAPFTPSVTGASQSAYDYLMGRGAYPTNQTLPGNAPLWRPYVQNVAAPAPQTFVSSQAPATTSSTSSTGFKPPAPGTPLTGGNRWVNTRTGERYTAPTGGYTPPSSEWVLETDNFSTDAAGTGSGAPGESGNTGGQAGGTSSVGVTGAEGASVDGANGGLMKLAMGGYAQGGYNLGSYSDGGRLLRGPGDGVSDSIPATIGRGQPARLADGEFVIPARIVSELGNGSTEAGARKLYAMMDRVQRARGKTTGKNKVAANTKAERFLPA